MIMKFMYPKLFVRLSVSIFRFEYFEQLCIEGSLQNVYLAFYSQNAEVSVPAANFLSNFQLPILFPD